MSVRWSMRAEMDLYAIGDFIELDDPVAAVRWVDRLRDRARRADAFPNAGRKVPEFDLEDVREVFLGNYRIVYRILSGGLFVLAVREGHELIDDVDPHADL